ncbi:hypothetical protein TNCV_688691 [Trichonephila clavipes]|nr:hypothetical protein TNCV_688691 [Trichonephila clavipes]
MSLVAPQNIDDRSIFIMLRKLMRMRDAVVCPYQAAPGYGGSWMEVVHYVSEYFSDDAVIKKVNLKVTLFSYSRAFDDGPHNFESSQVTRTVPELAPLSPNIHITPTRDI